MMATLDSATVGLVVDLTFIVLRRSVGTTSPPRVRNSRPRDRPSASEMLLLPLTYLQHRSENPV